MNKNPSSAESENDSGLSPEEVYNFFANMSYDELMQLANRAIDALDAASNREEAEEAVIKMAPFFMDCTFPRLDETSKNRLRECLDVAEQKYGSLAEVLGLSDIDVEDEPGDPILMKHIISTYRKSGVVPESETEAAWVAWAACHFSNEDYEALPQEDQQLLQELISKIEAAFGPIDKLAEKYEEEEDTDVD